MAVIPAFTAVRLLLARLGLLGSQRVPALRVPFAILAALFILGGVDQIIRVGGTGYAHYSTDAYANAFALLCRKHHPIVCVGNGLESKAQLPRYRGLAELLGGKLGCTRPLLDRVILPYKLQIGQSGVMIKPKLHLGFGISGAVNHMAGVSADTRKYFSGCKRRSVRYGRR